MKKINLKKYLIFAAVLLLAGLFFKPVQAANQESYTGEPLCLPGSYLYEQNDCLVMGPSAFLTSMTEKGIPVPFQPLPAYQPDSSYTAAPVPYLTVGENAFPLYASLDDAIARNPTRYLEAGFKYLAVSERVDRDDGVYYRLMNGFWVEAGEAYTECCIRSGRFQGLMF